MVNTRFVGDMLDVPRLSPVAVNVIGPGFEAETARLSDVNGSDIRVESDPAIAAAQ